MEDQKPTLSQVKIFRNVFNFRPRLLGHPCLFTVSLTVFCKLEKKVAKETPFLMFLMQYIRGCVDTPRKFRKFRKFLKLRFHRCSIFKSYFFSFVQFFDSI